MRVLGAAGVVLNAGSTVATRPSTVYVEPNFVAPVLDLDGNFVLFANGASLPSLTHDSVDNVMEHW